MVYRPRDVGQDARPIHAFTPPVQSAMVALIPAKKVADDARPSYARGPREDNCRRYLSFYYFDHTRYRAHRGARYRFFGGCVCLVEEPMRRKITRASSFGGQRTLRPEVVFL